MDSGIEITTTRLRVLVAIASYGTSNDHYLVRLIQEYQSMPFDIHIVILSNLQKNLALSVEVLVGLPNKNPWSLPFLHKKLFAERIDQYDLFIYSEDDMLVTEKNLRAFLKVSSVLLEDEIPGFLRIEKRESGEVNYPEVHGNFHWDPSSVRLRGAYLLASFTNEHAACYVLTQAQLRKAIESGGFLVGPHEWKYDLLCTAATDPYSQCGFRKLIPISHFDEFTIVHLSSKYIGKIGIDGPEMCRQVNALMKIGAMKRAPLSLFNTETKLKRARYSKDYYERPNPLILSLIPEDAQSVLSVGCGSGETELHVAESGLGVLAIPLDSVISANAAARGVEMVVGDLESARVELEPRRFDCLLLLNLLHLVEDPVEMLSSLRGTLLPNSAVIIQSPNMLYIRNLWNKIRDTECLWNFSNYEFEGVHFTSIGTLQNWCRKAGLKITKVVFLSARGPKIVRDHLPSFVESFLAPEFVVVAQPMDGAVSGS